MKIHIDMFRASRGEALELECKADSGERPMALDALLQAQETAQHDLAFRNGCRNGLCGVCTVNINGKPRLACRTKLRDGDELSAAGGLPRIKDLIVDREPVNRPLQGIIPIAGATHMAHSEAEYVPQSREAYLNLNRCIECYACLDGCPMHEANTLSEPESWTQGNPYAMLRIQQARLHPHADSCTDAAAMQLADDLGLATCIDCKGCRCGVGIDLKKDVIRPLLTRAAEIDKKAADSQSADGPDEREGKHRL